MSSYFQIKMLSVDKNGNSLRSSTKVAASTKEGKSGVTGMKVMSSNRFKKKERRKFKAGGRKTKTNDEPRCNHSHCLLSPLISSYNLFSHLIPPPHWWLDFSCHQVQSLSLSLFFSYKTSSLLLYPHLTGYSRCRFSSHIYITSLLLLYTHMCRTAAKLTALGPP